MFSRRPNRCAGWGFVQRRFRRPGGAGDAWRRQRLWPREPVSRCSPDARGCRQRAAFRRTTGNLPPPGGAAARCGRDGPLRLGWRIRDLRGFVSVDGSPCGNSLSCTLGGAVQTMGCRHAPASLRDMVTTGRNRADRGSRVRRHCASARGEIRGRRGIFFHWSACAGWLDPGRVREKPTANRGASLHPLAERQNVRTLGFAALSANLPKRSDVGLRCAQRQPTKAVECWASPRPAPTYQSR
jgi:hypothetical protein